MALKRLLLGSLFFRREEIHNFFLHQFACLIARLLARLIARWGGFFAMAVIELGQPDKADWFSFTPSVENKAVQVPSTHLALAFNFNDTTVFKRERLGQGLACRFAQLDPARCAMGLHPAGTGQFAKA